MVTQLRQAPLSASPRAGFRTGLRPLVAALLLALGPRAFALPTDPAVVAGQAVVRGAGGNSLVIDQASGKAAIDWRSFNIGAGEAVRFNQPSAAAMTVNRVTSNNPSEILGLISAPGSVFLINPSGIIFGRSAVVDVGSLVASTLTASTADLLTGRAVFTAAPGGSGAVRNEGSIVAAPGGSVSLIGTQVSNSGSISTPGGTTGLIAGERVSVDFEGDGLVRYQVDAAAARALVEHSGQITADGGRVALQAGARDALVDTVLNVDGVVRARGISQRGGEIYLDGGTRGSVLVSGTLDASGTAPGTAGGQLRVLGENVGLVGSARLDASGDAGGGSVLVGGNYQGGGPEHNATRAFMGSGVTINADALARGNGGRVITWADDWTRFYGRVSARGGAAGGDGGFVEVSGKQNLAFAGSVVTTAPQGRTGTLLLDPGDLYLGVDPSPAPPATAGTVPDFAGSSGFDYFIAAGSFATATNYTLSATQDVIFLTNLGFPSTSGQLVSIQAGRDIWQAGGVTSISTQGAGLHLTAGASPSGTGGVTLAAGINTNGGTLTISADGASQLSGAFAGGVGGLVKEGAGTLSLSNGSNSYSGGTTIRGGTLRAAAASALPAGGAVSLEGSGILDLADRAYSIGSLLGTSGTGIVLGNTGTGGLVVSQASDGSFDGVISGSGPSSGTGALAKQGPGALALGGTNTFTGLTQVSEGVLRVSRADGLNAASSLRVTGTGSFEIDNVAFNSLASLTLAGGLQGDAALAGRGNASYAGTVTLVGHASVRAAGASDVLTLTGLIDGQVDTPVSADPTLIKLGDGTLVLGGSGTNFFPEIMAGTLRAASSGVLPDKETLLGSGATLDISDTTQTIGRLLGGGASSSVVLGTSGALTVHQGLEGAYAGSISGGGSSFFIKDGSAALHLSGASPLYSGTTQVLAGLLSASGNGNVLGSGAVEVSGGATLGIDGVTLGVTSLSLQGSGVGGGGALTGTGTAAYGGPVALVNPGPVVVGVADGGTLSLAGALSGVPAMSVVKQGPGTLALGGASTYGGGTTIASGTLVAQHADALGSGQVSVTDGATLKIDGVALNAGALTLNGSGVGSGGALQGAGTASFGGTVTLATASAIGATAATDILTVSGPLTGSGSLAKVGEGRVRLSGSNDYAGGTTVSAGTLVAQHATALGTGAAGVSAGATLEIDNVALATGGLTLNGSGVGGAGALLGRGSASHAGAITLASASAIGAPTLADTLILTSPVSGAGSLSKVGAGTLQLPGGNSYAGSTTVEAGTLRLSGVSPANLGALSLTGTGVLDLNDTQQSIGTLSGSGGTRITLGSAGTGGLTVNQAGDGNFAGVISGSGSSSGTGALNKLGAGTLTLSGANTFTGLTRVAAGVLRVSRADALDTASSLLVTGSGSFEIDNVAFNSLASLTLAGGNVGQESLAGLGAASYGGTVTLLGFGRVAAATASDALTLSGRIDGQADLGADPTLTKAGAGTVTLSGTGNTYAGGTTIEAGTLVAQQAGALGTGPVTVDAGATLEIDNVTLATGGLTLSGSGVGGTGALRGRGSASHTGTVTLATASTIGTPTLTDTLSLDSPLTGQSLTKVGSGTLNLSGISSYAGGTTVAGGTLHLSTGAVLPSLGAVSLAGGGILELNEANQRIGNLSGLAGTGISLGSGSLTVSQASDGSFAGTLGGSGDLIKQGTASLTLSGANTTYTGTTRVQVGTLVAAGSGSALGTGAVQVSGGATLEIDGVTLATGGLTLNGSGVGGAGALQGRGTASHIGAVTLATASAIGAAASDTLRLANPVTGQALSKVGAGTVELSGSNSYAGGTTVEAGRLRLLAGASLPSLGAVSLTGSGVLDLNGTSQSIGNLSGAAGTTIALGSGTLTLTQSAAGSFAGLVTGSGNLTKQGSARLALSGASTGYSGTTRVQAGTLAATGSGSALGTGAVQVSDGATLAIDGVTLGVSSISLRGAGVGGLGALTGTGGAGYGGALSLTGPAAIGVAAAGDTLSLGGVLSGDATAGLTKLGAGTLRLSGASVHAGGTTIGAGSIEAAGDDALGTGAVRVEAGSLNVGTATLGNAIELAGGALNAVGVAQLAGNVSQTVDSRIAAAAAPASLTLLQAFAGGGHGLTIDGPGGVNLSGGASGLAAVVQNAGSQLGLGTGQRVVSSGAQTYGGVVTGHDVTLISSTRQAITADSGGNDFTGTLRVTAGDTTIRDANALSVLLDTGATTLIAGQALTLGGSADSLVTDSAALVFGATRVTGEGRFTARGPVSQRVGEALQVGGASRFDAGSQALSLTEAANSFGGRVTLKAGDTALSGIDSLDVALDGTGATALSAGQALTLAGRADSLATDSAALVFGATRVTGEGRFTARGPVSQRAGEALQVGGASRFDAGSQALSLTEAGNSFGGLVTLKAGQTDLHAGDSLTVALDSTGATTLTAGQALTVAGSADSLVTDSAALVFGATQVAGEGRFTARGPVSQRAGEALQVGGASAFDAGSQALSLTEAANSFGGLVTLKAGQTDLHAGDSLTVALDNTGATTLSAGQALTLGGSADSLATDSAALVFGATRVTGEGRFTARGPVSQRAGEALQVGGASRFDAGSQALSLTEAGNSFGGLVTLKAGQTDLHAGDNLTVALDSTGATTLAAGQALTLGGSAGSLATDSAALVFGATRVAGEGRFTARGPVSQRAGEALQVGGASAFDAGTQALSLTEAANRFGGRVTLKAGDTALRGSDSLDVALDGSGATTLSAGQALTLGGSAGSLATDSAALVFGATRVTGEGRFTARGPVSQLAGEALQVGGASTFDAGSQGLSLTEAANRFGGRVTLKAGDTALRGSDSLNVALDGSGATTLTAGQALTVAGGADSLVTDSAALVFGATRVAGDGRFTARGPVSQLPDGTLEVGGRTQLAVTLQSAGDSIVLANRGNALGAALSGEIDLGPAAADSRISSEQALKLGSLDVRGKGVLEFESFADMGKKPVLDVATVVSPSGDYPCTAAQPCVSVQSNEGTPQQLSVYEASIAQLAGTRITTQPEATLSLRASGVGSIDLSAEATVTVTPVGGVATTATGLAGLLSVYSKAGPEPRVLTHAGGTTNQIEGPLAAFTKADTVQQSADKTAVVMASDTIRVADLKIDSDTVMLMAREVAGGGGKIQTHVAATDMSDGRNIATGVGGSSFNPNYSILPSIFVIADAPGKLAPSYSFGSLANPISVSFGHVAEPAVNSLLQTIAVEPYRRADPAGVVPVYLDTRVQPGSDPSGPIRRFLVFPAGTPTGSIRMVVVDGVEILDSSAFASVQSVVAELLNQVRKEQLESGFSNENVAAQLRKGVITETRVGPAAVDRFHGVASAQGCVGTMIGEMMVCAPSAGPLRP